MRGAGSLWVSSIEPRGGSRMWVSRRRHAGVAWRRPSRISVLSRQWSQPGNIRRWPGLVPASAWPHDCGGCQSRASRRRRASRRATVGARRHSRGCAAALKAPCRSRAGGRRLGRRTPCCKQTTRAATQRWASRGPCLRGRVPGAERAGRVTRCCFIMEQARPLGRSTASGSWGSQRSWRRAGHRGDAGSAPQT